MVVAVAVVAVMVVVAVQGEEYMLNMLALLRKIMSYACLYLRLLKLCRMSKYLIALKFRMDIIGFWADAFAHCCGLLRFNQTLHGSE